MFSVLPIKFLIMLERIESGSSDFATDLVNAEQSDINPKTDISIVCNTTLKALMSAKRLLSMFAYFVHLYSLDFARFVSWHTVSSHR